MAKINNYNSPSRQRANFMEEQKMPAFLSFPVGQIFFFALLQ